MRLDKMLENLLLRDVAGIDMVTVLEESPVLVEKIEENAVRDLKEVRAGVEEVETSEEDLEEGQEVVVVEEAIDLKEARAEVEEAEISEEVREEAQEGAVAVEVTDPKEAKVEASEEVPEEGQEEVLEEMVA